MQQNFPVMRYEIRIKRLAVSYCAGYSIFVRDYEFVVCHIATGGTKESY